MRAGEEQSSLIGNIAKAKDRKIKAAGIFFIKNGITFLKALDKMRWSGFIIKLTCYFN